MRMASVLKLNYKINKHLKKSIYNLYGFFIFRILYTKEIQPKG
jgi:hypothetical protein